MSFFELILDLLYPKNCIGCRQRGTFLCKKCAAGIHYFPAPRCTSCGNSHTTLGRHKQCATTALDGLFAMGEYEGVLQTLIRHFKYDGQFALSESAVELITTHFPREFTTIDLIVPVPLHNKRLRERGFNQSELLAKGIARNMHISSASKLLVRTKHTTPQATLKRAERLHNLENAYALSLNVWKEIQSKKKITSILLIDDVSTTGSTLAACADALKHAGIKKVYGYVLAHGA